MPKDTSPKKSLRILNSREKKEINQQVEEQWGCRFDKDLVFLLSNKDRLYIAEKDISLIDMDSLRIDNLGLYVCNVSEKGIRLTIEGSQILGPCAKKNVVEVSGEEVRIWLKGKDIERQADGCSGYVIIRHGEDFLGCGLVTKRGILNYVPKTRRILSAD